MISRRARSKSSINRMHIVSMCILAACSEPTRPVTSSSSTDAQAAGYLADVPESVDFSDALERVLPSLDDRRLASELRACLARFDAAHARRERVDAQRALDDARALLAGTKAHVVSVGTIHLSIRRAQETLDAAADRSPSADR